MSDLYAVVPGSILHVKPLSRTLRPAACMTLQAFGLDPRRSLRRAFAGSRYTRTAIVGGGPIAMWGIQGPALSDSAIAWLALSDQAAKWPLAIVRCARQELAQMRQRVDKIYATVLYGDERAMLFAKTLGFQACEGDVPDGMALMMFGGA